MSWSLVSSLQIHWQASRGLAEDKQPATLAHESQRVLVLDCWDLHCSGNKNTSSGVVLIKDFIL